MSKMLVIFIAVGLACVMTSPLWAGTIRVTLEIDYGPNPAAGNERTVNEMRVIDIQPAATAGTPSQGILNRTKVPAPAVSQTNPTEISNPLIMQIPAIIGVSKDPANPDPCGWVWNPITKKYYYRCW